MKRTNSPETTHWSRRVNLTGTSWRWRDSRTPPLPQVLSRSRGAPMTAETQPECSDRDAPFAWPGPAPGNRPAAAGAHRPRCGAESTHRQARSRGQGARTTISSCPRTPSRGTTARSSAGPHRVDRRPRLDQRHLIAASEFARPSPARLRAHPSARSSCWCDAAAKGRRRSLPNTKFGPAIGESLRHAHASSACSRRIAPTDATVLLEGETGTGKDVARARHPPRAARAPTGRSSSSTAAPSSNAHRERALRPRARRVHGRGRDARRRVRARRRRARCSSTRSASCRSTSSPSCCACSRRASSGASAATRRCAPTCG